MRDDFVQSANGALLALRLHHKQAHHGLLPGAEMPLQIPEEVHHEAGIGLVGDLLVGPNEIPKHPDDNSFHRRSPFENGLGGVFGGALHFQEGLPIHHATAVEAIHEHEAVANHDAGIEMVGPVAAADLEAEAASDEHIETGQADGQAPTSFDDVDQIAVVGVIVVGAVAFDALFFEKEPREGLFVHGTAAESELGGEAVQEDDLDHGEIDRGQKTPDPPPQPGERIDRCARGAWAV